MKTDLAKKQTILFFIIFLAVFSVLAAFDYKNQVAMADERMYDTVANHEELQYLLLEEYTVEEVKRSSEDASVLEAKVKVEDDMVFLTTIKGDTVLSVSFLLHCEEGDDGKETCYSRLLYENQ